MSQELEISFPKIYYDKNDQQKYDELIHNSWSPFKGYTMAEVFNYTMAYAFKEQILPKDLPPTKDCLELPPNAFDFDIRSGMRALATHYDKDIKVIKDNKKVTNICERYANAAIDEVYQKLSDKPDEYTSEDILEKMINPGG